MRHYFTESQITKWQNSLPAIPIGAQAALYNTKGELLIVKPNYREFWLLAGGVVERHESPLHALRRELREELGLQLDADRFDFRGVAFESVQGERTPVLCILFGAELGDNEINTIRLQSKELEAYKFVAPIQAVQDAPGHSVRALVAMQGAGVQAGYTEDGVLLSAVGSV